MKGIIELVERGTEFIKKNPQISYTILLTILIPAAFIFTSEQFLSIAKENQDRLERGRVGAMLDAFAVLTRWRIVDVVSLSADMRELREQNPSLVRLRVIGPSDDGVSRVILASADQQEIGNPFNPDSTLSLILSTAEKIPEQSIVTQVVEDGERRWRAVRVVPGVQNTFLIADVSMVQADQEAEQAIRDAYLMLVPIVGLILILLARHAKIIDYASLYQRLAEVDRMKDDFVSMAAHELRAPLSVIRGYVEMAQDPSVSVSQRQEFLSRIGASAKQLNTLVEDILDVSRLQEGRMAFSMRPIDPSQVIVEVVNAFMLSAKEKGLLLSYEAKTLPEVLLDPDRFRQVMTNLIGNAVKYTSHGSVTISAESDGVEVVIRVSDTGPGISAQDQAKLFSKFYRVRNETTRDIPGTGLGLWITREIVRQMKGEISVESITGKGTDFIVRLPVLSGTA